MQPVIPNPFKTLMRLSTIVSFHLQNYVWFCILNYSLDSKQQSPFCLTKFEYSDALAKKRLAYELGFSSIQIRKAQPDVHPSLRIWSPRTNRIYDAAKYPHPTSPRSTELQSQDPSLSSFFDSYPKPSGSKAAVAGPEPANTHASPQRETPKTHLKPIPIPNAKPLPERAPPHTHPYSPKGVYYTFTPSPKFSDSFDGTDDAFLCPGSHLEIDRCSNPLTSVYDQRNSQPPTRSHTQRAFYPRKDHHGLARPSDGFSYADDRQQTPTSTKLAATFTDHERENRVEKRFWGSRTMTLSFCFSHSSLLSSWFYPLSTSRDLHILLHVSKRLTHLLVESLFKSFLW